MPLKSSKIRRKSKEISIKVPKGFRVDDVSTDIIGFRDNNKKARVGIIFNPIPPAPKFRGRKKIKRKPMKRMKRRK